MHTFVDLKLALLADLGDNPGLCLDLTIRLRQLHIEECMRRPRDEMVGKECIEEESSRGRDGDFESYHRASRRAGEPKRLSLESFFEEACLKSDLGLALQKIWVSIMASSPN